MKKILGLTVVVLIVMGLVGGGTWAYFSDPETSAGNVLTAGTLNLDTATAGAGSCTVVPVTGSDGAMGNVVFSLMKPGDSGSITWSMWNTGTLPGTLKVSANLSYGSGVEPEPETAVGANDASGGDLDLYLGVKLQRGVGVDAPDATGNLTYLYGDGSNYAKLSGLEAQLDDSTGVAVAAVDGGDDYFIYKLSWALAADIIDLDNSNPVDDNVIQGDTATCNVTFTLWQ